MASCYQVPYTDRFGSHTATKWGETPDEARKLVAKAKGIDVADVGVPALVDPQPFTGRPRATAPVSVPEPELEEIIYL